MAKHCVKMGRSRSGQPVCRKFAGRSALHGDVAYCQKYGRGPSGKIRCVQLAPGPGVPSAASRVGITYTTKRGTVRRYNYQYRVRGGKMRAI